MKKIVLLLALVVYMNAVEIDFKKTALDEFEIQGFQEKIIFKTKEERDNKIAKLWEKFFSSKEFSFKSSSDKKLYVTYFNYKQNSFDCFIGVKSKDKIKGFSNKTIKESKYQRGILKYEPNLNISKVWDNILKQKINRDFKLDMEEYNLVDLTKSKYEVTIYLSTK